MQIFVTIARDWFLVENINNEIRYYNAMRIELKKLDSYPTKFEQSIFRFSSLLF